MLDIEPIKKRIKEAYREDWNYHCLGIESTGRADNLVSSQGYTFKIVESDSSAHASPHEKLIAWSFYDIVRLVAEVERLREQTNEKR
jgi:hypothetical protein